MRICDSEENRRKLAWLVPGYILLAWFFCVVFQPLGLNSVPGHGNNNDLNDESLYEIINLQDDPQVIFLPSFVVINFNECRVSGQLGVRVAGDNR